MKTIKITDEQFDLLMRELRGLQEYYRKKKDYDYSCEIEDLADCIDMGRDDFYNLD